MSETRQNARVDAYQLNHVLERWILLCFIFCLDIEGIELVCNVFGLRVFETIQKAGDFY